MSPKALSLLGRRTALLLSKPGLSDGAVAYVLESQADTIVVCESSVFDVGLLLAFFVDLSLSDIILVASWPLGVMLLLFLSL